MVASEENRSRRVTRALLSNGEDEDEDEDEGADGSSSMSSSRASRRANPRTKLESNTDGAAELRFGDVAAGTPRCEV